MYFLISIYMSLIFINIINDVAAMQNGKKVEEGNFKFMAYITIMIDNEWHSCAGGVINEFHVITAAHCVACSELWDINIFVRSGSDVVSRDIFYQPARVYVHPNYTAAEESSSLLCLDFFKYMFFSFESSKRRWTKANDIAIVKVNRRITMGGNFTNVNLPVSESLPYCDVLYLAGWFSPVPLLVILQYIEVVLDRTSDCHVLHSSEDFCAITIDPIGRVERGDSGSPLVHNNTLYGIVYGMVVGGQETPGVTFVLTSIFHNRDFITEILEKGKEPGVIEEPRK